MKFFAVLCFFFIVVINFSLAQYHSPVIFYPRGYPKVANKVRMNESSKIDIFVKDTFFTIHGFIDEISTKNGVRIKKNWTDSTVNLNEIERLKFIIIYQGKDTLKIIRFQEKYYRIVHQMRCDGKEELIFLDHNVNQLIKSAKDIDFYMLFSIIDGEYKSIFSVIEINKRKKFAKFMIDYYNYYINPDEFDSIEDMFDYIRKKK
jgi:hypothetical protein